MRWPYFAYQRDGRIMTYVRVVVITDTDRALAFDRDLRQAIDQTLCGEPY